MSRKTSAEAAKEWHQRQERKNFRAAFTQLRGFSRETLDFYLGTFGRAANAQKRQVEFESLSPGEQARMFYPGLNDDEVALINSGSLTGEEKQALHRKAKARPENCTIDP